MRTNILENAGCATSEDCGASTSSAYEVTSISRVRIEPLSMDRQPHFGIVLRRHLHFERGGDVAVDADDLGAIFGEAHFIRARLTRGGLITRRPHASGVHVAQQQVAARVVARRVFAPAGHRQIVPAAVARSGRRDHHGIAAIRQQMCLRRGVVRTADAPHVRHLQVGDARRGADFLGTRMRHRHIARRAFLQQQLGGLHRRRRNESARACGRRAARWRWQRCSCPGDAPCRRAPCTCVAPSGRRLGVKSTAS